MPLLLAVVTAYAEEVPVWSPDQGNVQLGDVSVTYADGALKFSGSRESFIYQGNYLPSVAQGKWGLVKENARLTDFEFGPMKFKTVSGHSTAIDGTATPRFVERTDDTLSAQFMRSDSSYVKGVKLCLRQNGNNIEGQVSWAKYVSNANFDAEDDFEPLGTSDGVNIYTVATEDNPTRGYGADYIELHPVLSRLSKIRMNVATEATSVTLEKGVELQVGTAALTQKDGTLPAGIAMSDSKMVLSVGEKAPVALNASAVLTGQHAAMEFVAEEGTFSCGGSYQVALTKTLTKSYADAVIPNTRLKDLVGTRGWLGGDYMACSANYNIEGLFFDNRSEIATCQYQFFTTGSGGQLKCVMMELKQVGADIQIATPYGKVLKDAKSDDLRTFRFTPSNGAGDYAPAHYNVTNVVLNLKSEPGTYKPGLVTLDGTNRVSGMSMTFRGAEGRDLAACVKGSQALPAGDDSLIDICKNATLTLDSDNADSCGISGGKAVIRVEDGGELRNRGSQDVGYNRIIKLLGGKLCMGLNRPYDEFDWTYVKRIYYYDGAESYGVQSRGGNGHNWAIFARGDKPSVARNGFQTVSMNPSTLTFDVDDVTKDAAPDFTVTGKISFYNTTYNKETVAKTGSGTMRLEGPFTCKNNPVRLRAGTLELGKSGVADDVPFAMAGGALAVEPGTTHACGKLLLQETSSLVLTEGAQLTFASFERTSGKKLMITAPQGAKVRIDRDGMPSSMLRGIRLNGQGCYIDEDGYLALSGFQIIVK